MGSYTNSHVSTYSKLALLCFERASTPHDSLIILALAFSFLTPLSKKKKKGAGGGFENKAMKTNLLKMARTACVDGFQMELFSKWWLHHYT